MKDRFKLERIKCKVFLALLFVLGFLLLPVYVLAESSIWVDPSTGRITVKAPREKMKVIEEALPTLSVQARQIEIEARIVEVSSTITKKFGTYLEKLTGLEVPTATLGEGSKIAYGPRDLTELSQGQGAFQFDFYKLTSKERFEAILNALVSEGKAEILSNPRVVTLSGEVAGIYVTTEVPYLSSITYETINETQVPVEHYDYATVGIVLQVLPRIVGEDLVEMSIVPLVGNYEISPEFGAQHPIFKRQVSPTNVTIKDGEELVIGGLITKEKSRQTVGLPILSRLPILGNIFKSRVDVVEDKNLLITIRPHILKQREIEGRVKKVFKLEYALASEVAEQIRKVLSSQGSLEVNPPEAPPNSIIVRDREDRIRLAQSLLNRIGTFEAQKKQKVYKLLYTPVEEAEKVVKDLLSSRGSFKVMEGKNALFVEDGAYQISIIDSAISVLEQYNSVPKREFISLQFISPLKAKDYIAPLLSPQGEVIPLSDNTVMVKDNKLSLEKIKERLEEIEKIREKLLKK
ncbi:MAG TPA: hypothetical protein ENL39_02085 [Candidatus Aerophobetes bacterium]|uniref:Type II/III secretion system secretin-like domain-containing protein n=1 Tax=Aerophobetes bacterium TaxID=2030807 RepID=A0A7V5HYG7_UNCAE|nr:hypothetical protein [Candidatus Aerophobetes bacterium]